MNTAFYGIFKSKLSKMKKELKDEMKLEKKTRRKDFIRRQIKEIKKLQKTVDQMEEAMNINNKCPNCGHKL